MGLIEVCLTYFLQDVEDKELCKKLDEPGENGEAKPIRRPLAKVLSLPKNYTYSPFVRPRNLNNDVY